MEIRGRRSSYLASITNSDSLVVLSSTLSFHLTGPCQNSPSFSVCQRLALEPAISLEDTAAVSPVLWAPPSLESTYLNLLELDTLQNLESSVLFEGVSTMSIFLLGFGRMILRNIF